MNDYIKLHQNYSMRSLIIIISLILITFSCRENKKTNNQKPTKQSVINVNSFEKIWVKKIDEYFTKKYNNNKFNGVVLFAHCGNPFYKKSFGVTDFKSKVPLTLQSNFQLASVSKPITSIAILQLYDKGLLKIDDDITKYIPELPYEGITIRMLLTHESGLFNYMYFCDRFWDSWTKPISNEETIELICKKEPNIWFYPGRKYNYSNTGYMLLATIVERITKTSFAHYLEENVFKPSNMKTTHVFDACLTPTIKDEGVTGYRPNKRKAENTYLDGVVGDKGVYSNVLDLFKLDQNLYTNKLVQQSTLNLAYTPQHKRLHIDDNYGLGWRIDSSNPNEKIVYHSGWWKGFRSHFIRVLPNQATIIVLSNFQRGRITKKELLGLIGY